MRIAYPSEASSQLLGSRQYGSNASSASNQDPAVVTQAPPDMMSYVWGRALGVSGQFAYFGFLPNFANTAPGSGLVPMYPQAVAVATGDRFEFFIPPGQSLYVLGSVSPANNGAGQEVWVTYQISYFQPQWPMGETAGPGGSGPGGGGGGYFGPPGHFVLR